MNALTAIDETVRHESLANEPLTAFVADAGTREAVQAAIGDRWPNATIHEGGLGGALGMLSQDPSPPLLVVDIAGTDAPDAGLRSLFALCDPATRVIAIGTVNDIGFYRRLVGLGVADYIVKPIEAKALIAAIDGAKRPRPVLKPVEEERKRNIVTVLGARGGVGASTVAVNLAWIMAHELKRSCAIVDLDLQFGTVALQLDLEPSHGLREALENPDRIDSLFIASAMASESENLHVLSAEEPFDERVRFSADSCAQLIEALPDQLTDIVVDLPVRSAVETPAVLESADKLVLVSDLSLVGMRDLVRLGRLCRDANATAEIVAVLNRTGMARKGEIPKAEFARGTEIPLRHTVPFNPTLAANAANGGKPFPTVAGRSPTVRALRALTAEVARGPAGAGSAPAAPFARLLALGRRKR